MKKLLILLSVLFLTLSVKAQIPTRSQIIGQYIAATVGVNTNALQNYFGTFGMMKPVLPRADTSLFTDSILYTCPGFAWQGFSNAGGVDSVTAVQAYCAHPFYVNPGQVIKGLTVRVGVGAATDTADVGIYSDNGYGYPGALVVDAGKFKATTTGAKYIDLASPLALQANTIYWLCIVSDTTTASFIGVSTRSTPNFLGMNIKNWSANVGWVTSNGYAWNASNTTELPATFPTKGALTDAATGIPCIWVFF